MEESISASPRVSNMLPLRLTSLAPELKHIIFVYLPDVPSAKALALTSSSFYQTFLDAQALILTQVLQKQMDTEILRDCFTALRVSQIQVWSKKAVLEIINEYFGGSIAHTLHTWKLSEAVAVSKVHDYVEFFATEFASSALFKNPTARGANAAPSSSEMRRIKLTLHRFELYCNLFRYPGHDRMVRNKLDRNRFIRPYPFSAQEQQKFFFESFSPWENEQLGCIHDFLIREITIPFCDVARHDVDWGERSVRYIDHDTIGENHYKKYYLRRGLEYLYRLITANNYDARLEILDEEDPEPHVSGRRLDSLADAFRFQVQDDGVPLRDYTEEEENIHIGPSFNSDSDRGPVQAWRWAHSNSSRSSFYFQERHQPLRQRGYVMWDMKRLLGWNLIEKPVADLIARNYPGYPERLRRSAERDEETQSFRERSRIYMEGGRGWWAPGDESRIQWPEH